MVKTTKPESLVHMITRVTVERCTLHGNKIPAHVLRTALRLGIPVPVQK